VIHLSPGRQLHLFGRPNAGGTSTVEAPLPRIAFRLPNDATAQSLGERLRAHGVEVTEIPELVSFRLKAAKDFRA